MRVSACRVEQRIVGGEANPQARCCKPIYLLAERDTDDSLICPDICPLAVELDANDEHAGLGIEADLATGKRTFQVKGIDGHTQG